MECLDDLLILSILMVEFMFLVKRDLCFSKLILFFIFVFFVVVLVLVILIILGKIGFKCFCIEGICWGFVLLGCF